MDTRPLPSSVNAEGPSNTREDTTPPLNCTFLHFNHFPVGGQRIAHEKINEINYLDHFLQANVFQKQGLARGYESEI
jgi:hypothetical protein